MKHILSSSFVGLALTATPALAQQDGYYHDHGHMFGGEGWGYIAFIAVTVVLVVLAFRWLSTGHGKGSSDNDDAMAVLRKRFASGEIDEEEFEARRRTLNQS